MSSYDALVLRYWLMVAAYIAVLTLIASILVLAASVTSPVPGRASRVKPSGSRRGRQDPRPVPDGREISAERSSPCTASPLSRESFASDHDRVSP